MGDPLSIAASVASLLSLGLQTADYLYKYYKDCASFSSEVKRTTEKLGDLVRTIQIIDETLRARKWQPSEKTILQNIESVITNNEDIIIELQDEVRKFEKVPAQDLLGKLKAVGRQAAYPIRRSTLEKLEEDVNEFRHSLSLVLQALQLKDHQTSLDELEEIKNLIKNAQSLSLSADVRLWLNAPDATIDYNNACAKRHGGTGQWLIKSPSFTKSLTQDNSCLWLYGFAGCGKSVLCSTVIQHTFRQSRLHTGSAIAFFFFTFNDETKRDASAVLRALLFQLCGQITGLTTDLARLRDSSNHGTPAVSVLVEYLRQAVTKCRHQVYIILDGIDESPANTSRAEVLSLIETIRRWQLPNLHLTVTSRDVPDIRDSLDGTKDVGTVEFISMKNDEVKQDIVSYISYQVDHDPQLRRWGDRCQRIKEYLAEHAAGVFRWVDCQFRPLRQCARSPKQLENCLRSLPPDLDRTYERILCNIDDGAREEAQRILSFLCYCARPLSANEVIEAIAVDIDDEECYDEGRRLESADDLLRICPELIEINYAHPMKGFHPDNPYVFAKDGDDGDDGADTDQIVRIAHFSVQEYLTSKRITQSRAAYFTLSGSKEHARITKVCLLYLANDTLAKQVITNSLLERYSLALYATKYWHLHYQLTESTFAQQLLPKIITFLTTDYLFNHWVNLHSLKYLETGAPIENRIRSHNSFWSPVYFASEKGLIDVLQNILLQTQPDLNAHSGWDGTPLIAATFRGRTEIVRILLEHGADANARVDRNGPALSAASVKGYKEIVRLLLEHGADVNAKVKEYGTALLAASIKGHSEIVRLLVEHGADVNVKVKEYGTALLAASDKGREETVQLMLEHGAYMNATVDEYRTALQAVSSVGYIEAVRLLLEHGADVNTKADDDETALLAESCDGYKVVVQLLLKHGADVNTKANDCGTALPAASFNGYEEIVRLLLEHGANVNAEVNCRTALQTASLWGYEEIVRLLLEHGADVNAKVDEYGTALQAASGAGCTGAARLLLEHGADVNVVNGVYHTAFQAASAWGHSDVVQLLLDHGADVDVKATTLSFDIHRVRTYEQAIYIVRKFRLHDGDADENEKKRLKNVKKLIWGAMRQQLQRLSSPALLRHRHLRYL